MIFTVIDCEIKETKLGHAYYHFKLEDDYHNIIFAQLGGVEKLIKDFHKKNGIYWGDTYPFTENYIGMILSCGLEWTRYANRTFKRVDLFGSWDKT